MDIFKILDKIENSNLSCADKLIFFREEIDWCDVNELNSRNENIFHIIMYENGCVFTPFFNRKLIIFLLEKGVKPNVVNKIGQTPMDIAINMGDIFSNRRPISDDNLLFLRDEGFCTTKKKYINKYKNEAELLHKICETPYMDLEEYIDYKNIINLKNKEGQTPLLVAVLNNKSSGFIKSLLKHGADINLKNNNDETPIYSLTNIRNCSSMEKLLRINKLFELGADINILCNGNTLLHNCFNKINYMDNCDVNFQDIIYSLIEKTNKNIINLKNQDGKTILFLLAEKHICDFLGMFRRFFNKNIDYNIMDNEGNTLLHRLFENRFQNFVIYSGGKIDIDNSVKFLIKDVKFNFNSKNKNKKNVLDMFFVSDRYGWYNSGRGVDFYLKFITAMALNGLYIPKKYHKCYHFYFKNTKTKMLNILIDNIYKQTGLCNDICKLIISYTGDD